MIDRLILAAPAVRAVSPVQALVERQRSEDTPTRSARQPSDPGTIYTPQAKQNDDTPLYFFKGKPSAATGMFAAASYDKTQSLDLKVRTADGDVVSLSFAESTRASVSTDAASAGPNSATTLSLDTSQSSGLRISVQGQLSEEERAAINVLASQVSQVADDFFSGNMAQAQQGASQIDIRGQASSLSAFSLNLTSRETQMAAAIYDNVAQTTLPAKRQTGALPLADTAPPAPNSNVGPNNLLKNLMALFNRIAGQPPPEPTKAT